jgi:hypothetical protein
MSASAVLSIDSESADVLMLSAATVQVVDKHRWYTRQLVVVTRDALVAEMHAVWSDNDTDVVEAPDRTVPQHDHFCFYYLEPPSELQEDQDCYDSDPVEVFVAYGTIKSVMLWSTEVSP